LPDELSCRALTGKTARGIARGDQWQWLISAELHTKAGVGPSVGIRSGDVAGPLLSLACETERGRQPESVGPVSQDGTGGAPLERSAGLGQLLA
jgi:hypothetical protein